MNHETKNKIQEYILTPHKQQSDKIKANYAKEKFAETMKEELNVNKHKISLCRFNNIGNDAISCITECAINSPEVYGGNTDLLLTELGETIAETCCELEITDLDFSVFFF